MGIRGALFECGNPLQLDWRAHVASARTFWSNFIDIYEPGLCFVPRRSFWLFFPMADLESKSYISKEQSHESKSVASDSI